MKTHLSRLLFLFILGIVDIQASYILIPMDEDHQNDHLKAYGIAFWTLENSLSVNWLLNYRGGSFFD